MDNWSIIFLVLWVVLVGFGIIKVMRQARASRDWLTTSGTIVESRIRTETDSDGSTDYPVVVYEYDVEGQRYRSDQLDFAGSGAGGTGARGVVKRYPFGSSVTVYFNPSNPAQAVLSRSATRAIFVYGLAAGVVLVILFVLVSSVL